MKTVMVTGSSGQLGTRLTKNLSEAGFNVIGIGTRQISENVNNFNSYIKFDLLKDDFDSLIKQIRPKILIHLAWETEPKTFWASPKNFLWLDASKKLVESFNNWGGERIMVAGTCAEYDWDTNAPYTETTPELPKSLYGQSKLALLEFLRLQHTPFLWTRTFFQFGGSESIGRLIPTLIDTLAVGQTFSIEKPNDIRDFIYVDDVARIMSLLVASTEIGVFNVASGFGISIKQVSEMIASMLGRQDSLNFQVQDEKPSIVRADISKLQRSLGPVKQLNLEEAISRAIGERVRP
jgi:UDP-glucuronate decarboxylase